MGFARTFPNSAAFAMGKFALRGLAQSMAREMHPQGIHVIHVVEDLEGYSADPEGYLASHTQPIPASTHTSEAGRVT